MTRVQLAIGTGLLIVSVAVGWYSRGWLEDSQRLTAMQAAEAAIAAAMERESNIARRVEERLAELQASERVIDRGIIREVEKPVYRRVCLEPDAIRLLNHAAAGTIPDTADTADPLPVGTATTD
ncbi:hypothetical protein HCU01_33410 [Halomonas cupida]|uniref:Uncharacterized protein n=1 Tax=Halomonas cupida TaxID=44933 RepID=A0A1M7KH95_9GAMM|nr:hypothetical protein [Halomonas cupida]GEN25392.1 hypothetical protein HCU01_33410 [Halomonas cupida]SHM64671.1 hypothetical protein SAMN05660971_03513 [Halomonas cupida]